MYEVFFNDRKITIAAPGKITLNKSRQIIDYLKNKEDVNRWFYLFLENDIQKVVVINSAPEKFFKNIFQPVFNSIPAAGGIVIRKNKLLFIFRNKKWDLPKGKIDAGESNKQAALREVEEECGISGHKIRKQLPSTFHIFQSPHKESKGKWIFKETFWFEMEYAGVENGNPQADENITKLKWFDLNELKVPFSNTYANLKPIISLYGD
ncbi:MAG: NUDIX domain-containing protein [Draconibacterium sp.]|nr:NUDIX domain-containing protein [Draconibacterium sp.]